MGIERSSARLPERNTTHKAYTWTFKQRFRKGAFGWRSQPAVTRVKEAIAEIVAVAKKDQVIGAEGAVLFLERVSPALENVDSSSGAIGSAVHAAIEKLAPIIASAPADLKTRETWLERLFEAHESDQIPCIERLAEFWGELCSTEELANRWADRLIDVTRMALSADRNLRGHFHGSSACLSALYRARRFDEIIDIVSADVIWPYKRWAVKALFAQGKKAEAIRYAEACRSPWASEFEIACLCEEILLSSGIFDEAYDRYGRVANRRGTHLATFRAIAKRYPHKKSREILADLVRDSPGEEGKWFAAAKDAGLYDNAIALAASAPCDPRTLTSGVQAQLS